MPRMPALPLSTSQKQSRVLGLLFIVGFLAYAFLLNPNWSVSAWALPDFRNVIGLPCLLCGGTRAMHFILHGDFQRALYYNWIAFPALASALVLVLVMSLEIARRRVLLPTVRLRTSQWILVGAVAVSLWAHHVYDALHSPKPELLNEQGIFFQLSSAYPHSEVTR